ncbi:MAG: flagellar biosynthetic protein FliO [Ignavibacteriales bacterium]|nr:flagellar biosynthetic protein FliO [Ignavibacteriales bacterium]
MAWTLFQALLSLLAVLALMVGVLFVMKKYMSGTSSTHASLVDVDVVGYKMLQPKKGIYVVKILSRAFVVGSSEDGLRTLGEIDGMELEDALQQRGAMEAALHGSGRRKTFVDYLGENIGLKKK